MRRWRRRKRLVAAVVVTMTLSTAAEVYAPVWIGRLTDVLAAGPAQRSEALTAFFFLAGLGIGAIALRHLAWWALTPLTLGMMRDTTDEAFSRAIRLSTEWHVHNSSGGVVRKVTRGMWAVDMLNDVLLLSLLPSAVVLGASVALMARQWPVLGAIMVLGVTAYVVLTVLLATRVISPASRLSNEWDTRIGALLTDVLGASAAVKAFAGEAREDRRLAALTAKWRRRTWRGWMRNTWSSTAQLAWLWLVRTAVTATALFYWWNGRASVGDLTFVLTAYLVVHAYLKDIGAHIHHLQLAVNQMQELVELHAEPIGVPDRASAPPLVVTAGDIRFNSVTFAYPGQPARLYDGLSVHIPAGQKVGLVGLSGAGKTSFVKLLQRLYDPVAGSIAIDGVDIAGVTQESLRHQIALVPQEPVLFHRSIADNIGYGCPDAGMAAIERAARLAHADRFINALPHGYRTLVGDRGVRLSGGERQRVALARAFLVDAPILVLDEATSNLDAESEVLIQAAIAPLMADRTTVVIAHRLATVRMLDRILVFEHGRIIEDGPPADLMGLDAGRYRRLVEQQGCTLVLTQERA